VCVWICGGYGGFAVGFCGFVGLWVFFFFFFFCVCGFAMAMVDGVCCFTVNLFDFVSLVMGFVQWVLVGCRVGRGGLGGASGGSSDGGFLVDLGVLGFAFSLQFGEMSDCENLEGRFMG
jgi:uncharacterized membrane protein YgcG